MGASERRKQKKREQKAKQRKKRLKVKAQSERPQELAFTEGLDSYASEYRKVSNDAPKQHKSLLRVIECDDGVFYGMDTESKLTHYGFGHLSQVIVNTVDEIDFTLDNTTSEGGMVNANRTKSEGASVTGFTTVAQDQSGRRFAVIFIRKETGTDGSEEVKCATKLAALFHELGHVDDIEKMINWREDKVNLVDAEVYAHHYACKRLIAGNHRVLLGYYMTGLEEMARSQSEYVRTAAMRVVESKEYQEYVAAVPSTYSGSILRPPVHTAAGASRHVLSSETSPTSTARQDCPTRADK